MERDLSQKLIDVLERAAAALERAAAALERLAPEPEAPQEETPEKAPAKAKNKEVK